MFELHITTCQLLVVVCIVCCLTSVSVHSEIHSRDDESSESVLYGTCQTPDRATGTQGRVWAGEWTTPTQIIDISMLSC